MTGISSMKSKLACSISMTATRPNLPCNSGRHSAADADQMFKVETFSNAVEAQRCIRALDRIEQFMLVSWRNELREIGQRHPDLGDVVDSLVASLHDAWEDSAGPTARGNLSHSLDRFEDL